MEELFLDAKDGYKLSLNIFEVENCKAIVQIAHGMEEHKERYNDFAKFLNEKGFTLVTADMRGHGKFAKDLGYFADKKGYELLILDQVEIITYIKERFKGKPIYLFAHSMGTIISRVVLQTKSKDYDKVILSGYPAYNSAASLGIFITGILKSLHGSKYKSRFIENLGVGAFNRKIKTPKTKIDWICSNAKTLQDYFADPLCGKGFTVSAFSDLFHLVKDMNKHKNYVNVNHTLPILLLAGSDDPCTRGEKGRKHSYKILKKAGFNNIKVITYQGKRHELINETDKDMIYDDIAEFLEK